MENWAFDLTLAEAAEATRGRILAGDPYLRLGEIGTDTRTLAAGQTYLPIVGENFDGHDFLPQAVAAGANALIAQHPPNDPPSHIAVLQVEDTTRAYGHIARAHRRKMGTRMLALSGSSGKTTTKEMMASVLRQEGEVLATEGNLNNHIGVPRTLLRLTPDHDFAVIETGMNHAGELNWLVEVAEPHAGLLTHVGDAHIGNFGGSREGIAAAKAELIHGLPAGAPAILNADCPYGVRLANEIAGRRDVILFGESPSTDVRAANIAALADGRGYRFDLQIEGESAPVELQVFGLYQVSNALAAAAGCHWFGLGADTIAHGLSRFAAPKMRSEREVIAGVTVIADCYNASPSATRAAMKSFATLPVEGRRVLLLGDLFELGDAAEEHHRQLGRDAAALHFDRFVCYGPQARWMAESALADGLPTDHFLDPALAAHRLRELLAPGDALLAKGSRGARLERVLEEYRGLVQPPPAPAEAHS